MSVRTILLMVIIILIFVIYVIIVFPVNTYLTIDDGFYNNIKGMFKGTHGNLWLDVDNQSVYISEDYESWNFTQYIGKEVNIRIFSGCGRAVI